MKKSISLFVIIAALALTGCTYTRTVNLDGREHPSFTEINRLGTRKMATLKMARGYTEEVTNLQISPDSISWRNSRFSMF